MNHAGVGINHPAVGTIRAVLGKNQAAVRVLVPGRW